MPSTTSSSAIACRRLLEKPEVRLLLDLLAKEGFEGRLVGGCVRDALLGKTGADIDIAVNAPPTVTQALFERAGFKVIPTGLQHGTITVLVGHEPFELTSLRRDIITDGRHATVAYTTDWREDAARRDFTFNALYLSTDGRIDDFFGGQTDLACGLVRFIGDPDQRIQEDFLRILRYYRFVQRFTTVEENREQRPLQLEDKSLNLFNSSSFKEELKGEVDETLPACPAPEIKEKVQVLCCERSYSRRKQEGCPPFLDADSVSDKKAIKTESEKLLRSQHDRRSSQNDHLSHQSAQALHIPELRSSIKTEDSLKEISQKNLNNTDQIESLMLLQRNLEERLDHASHKAVRHHIGSLQTLSKERIQAELFKILAFPFPQAIIALMETDGVFQALFSKSAKLENLDRLVRFQKVASPLIDEGIKILERLFLLFPYDNAFYTKHLRLSRIQLKQLEDIFRIQNLPLTAKDLFAIRHRYGDTTTQMKIDLSLARTDEPLDESDLPSSFLCNALAAPQPPFPLQGADLLQLGLKPGKAMGALLREAENFWLESEGRANKEACLCFIQEHFL